MRRVRYASATTASMPSASSFERASSASCTCGNVATVTSACHASAGRAMPAPLWEELEHGGGQDRVAVQVRALLGLVLAEDDGVALEQEERLGRLARLVGRRR